MSGFSKAVVVALVAGAICFSGPQGFAAAEQDSGDDEAAGDVPLYILQLMDYSSAGNDLEEGVLKPEIMEYQVQPGDSLYSIAKRFDTDLQTLIGLNNIVNPHYILSGSIIEVLTVSGSVHDVAEGDTIAHIAEKYGVDEEVILAANSFINDDALQRGERVIIPGAFLDRGGYGIEFRWPLQGVLTSGYGWRNGKFHYAIDIAAPLGTPFYAASAGRVTHAGYMGAYGLMVEVEHGEGYVTRYAHAGRLAVSRGQSVATGQVLGYVGLTGNTTGPHLHFELHRYGERLNPLHHLY